MAGVPEWIVVHHTDTRCDKHPEQVAIVEGTHKRRGYLQSPTTGQFIAYQWFVGCDATVRNTRPDNEPSTHTGCGLGETRCKKGMSEINEHSIAVVIAGALDKELPSRAQMKNLKSVVEQLQKKYNIPNDHVIPHRVASGTLCPGTRLFHLLWPDRA